MIRTYLDRDRLTLLELWNTTGVAMGYAPLEAADFDRLFLKHPDFSPEFTFLLELDGEVRGFVNGCTGDHIPRGTERGYVTCLLLKAPADTRENARLLLSALEEAFRQAGRCYSAVTFFNPIRLPWIIPGTPGHQHNNAPGVATDLPLNGWMRESGYQEATREQAMYRSLEDFSMPQAILDRAEAMAREGYAVEVYDPRHHQGLEEMLSALENPLWCQEIPEAGRKGMYLLVGLSGNICAGFTGPVYPEKTGRGYFAGIGVDPRHQRHGLGRLLFYRLLQAEQEAGAAYMSLFTGEDNPARFLYQEAGFRVARTFSVLLKEL